MTSPAEARPHDCRNEATSSARRSTSDLAAAVYAGRRWSGTAGNRIGPALGPARSCGDPHALSARAERLPAHRTRQVDLPELRAGTRLRRPLPHALRRHQPRQGRAGVRRLHPRRGAAGSASPGTTAGETTSTTPATTSSTSTGSPSRWSCAGHAYVDSQSADEMRGQPRHADRAGPRFPVPRPRLPRKACALLREMRDGPASRRQPRAAREDRHGARRT